MHRPSKLWVKKIGPSKLLPRTNLENKRKQIEKVKKIEKEKSVQKKEKNRFKKEKDLFIPQIKI